VGVVVGMLLFGGRRQNFSQLLKGKAGQTILNINHKQVYKEGNKEAKKLYALTSLLHQKF